MNWNRIFYSVLGVLTYLATSALLPNWSHLLVGILTALLFLIPYWAIGNKLKMWIRVSISVTIAIVATAFVRLLCL